MGLAVIITFQLVISCRPAFSAKYGVQLHEKHKIDHNLREIVDEAPHGVTNTDNSRTLVCHKGICHLLYQAPLGSVAIQYP
jgi:hypothetical protein